VIRTHQKRRSINEVQDSLRRFPGMRFGGPKIATKFTPITKRFLKDMEDAHIRFMRGVFRILPVPSLDTIRRNENKAAAWQEFKWLAHRCGPTCEHKKRISNFTPEEMRRIEMEFIRLLGPEIDRQINEIARLFLQAQVGLLPNVGTTLEDGIYKFHMFNAIVEAGTQSINLMLREFNATSAAFQLANPLPASFPQAYSFDASRAFIREIYANGFRLVTDDLMLRQLPNIKKLMVEGLLEGKSLAQIGSNINKIEGTGRIWKRERLIRTEMAAAIDRTSKETYKEQGIEFVRWSAAAGRCIICERIVSKNRGFYRVSEVPSITGDTHPNCRCFTYPVYNLPRGITFN